MSDPFDPELNDSFQAPFSDAPTALDSPVHVPWWVQWRPAIIVGAILSAVASVVFLANQTPGAPVVIDTTTTVPTECTEASPVTCFSLTRVIKNGSKGDDVRRLQTRLKELKFDPGKIDGVYGGDTRMAVWAFQGSVLKLKGKEKVDFVTPALWDVMRGNVQIVPRRQPGTPNHVEVYLPEQVLTVYKLSLIHI